MPTAQGVTSLGVTVDGTLTQRNIMNMSNVVWLTVWPFENDDDIQMDQAILYSHDDDYLHDLLAPGY